MVSFYLFVSPADIVLKLLQLENLLHDQRSSPPNPHCHPGSYLSQTSSVSLIPQSPPASTSKEKTKATSSLWSEDFTQDESDVSFDLFNNPLNSTINESILVPCVRGQSKEITTVEKSDKQNSKQFQTEEIEVQNNISSNQLESPSTLKKTIENRLNLSASHVPVSLPGTSSEFGCRDDQSRDCRKQKLFSGLDEEDQKAKLTFTTKKQGKQRKKCTSKLKEMLQNKRETAAENIEEAEKQKNKTKTVVPSEDTPKNAEFDQSNSLSGKVCQLYSDFKRTKKKQMDKSVSENGSDEKIHERNENKVSTHTINTDELFNKVQPDEKKKTSVPTCERLGKSSLSHNTVSKLMKFAFDDSRSSSLSTTSPSVSESSENLNKSNVSDTVHPPTTEPLLSSSDSIFSKCNETANLTDLLSGHKWQTPPINDQNPVSSEDVTDCDSLQIATSPSISAAQESTDVKQKEPERLHHVSQGESMNISPISSDNTHNIALSSQPDFTTSSVHISTPISIVSANVTKRSSSMFEIDDDDLDFDFDVGDLQSDAKRARLK